MVYRRAFTQSLIGWTPRLQSPELRSIRFSRRSRRSGARPSPSAALSSLGLDRFSTAPPRALIRKVGRRKSRARPKLQVPYLCPPLAEVGLRESLRVPRPSFLWHRWEQRNLRVPHPSFPLARVDSKCSTTRPLSSSLPIPLASPHPFHSPKQSDAESPCRAHQEAVQVVPNHPRHLQRQR